MTTTELMNLIEDALFDKANEDGSLATGNLDNHILAVEVGGVAFKITIEQTEAKAPDLTTEAVIENVGLKYLTKAQVEEIEECMNEESADRLVGMMAGCVQFGLTQKQVVKLKEAFATECEEEVLHTCDAIIGKEKS